MTVEKSTLKLDADAYPETSLYKEGVELLGIFLVLRLLTFAWAARLSVVRPLTALETLLPAWPPASPLSLWLNRVLLSPLDRWDADWFLKIVTQGYQAADGTAQFHPLYPWLAAPLYKIGLDPILALLLVGGLACLALLLFFDRLARLDLTGPEARLATLSFIFFPAAFILFCPYSESLFLLLSVLCLYATRRKQWFWAGAAGGLAALTRQQGIFLVVPLAWEMANAAGFQWKALLRDWQKGLALLLVPAGLLVWLVYRGLTLSDVAPNFHNLNTLIYSLLISPSAIQVVDQQAFIWPWSALAIAFQHLWRTPDPDLIANLVVSAWFLLLAVLAWPRQRTSYRLYTVLTALVSFGYYTGPLHPYMGLPRHLFLAFPVFIGLAPALKRRTLRLLAFAISLFGFLSLLSLYGLHAWVP